MNDTKKERRKAEKRLFFLLGLDEDDCPTSEDDEDEKDLGRPKQKSWEELCEIVDRKQAWEQQLQRNRRFSLELKLLEIKISLEQQSRRFASLEENQGVKCEFSEQSTGDEPFVEEYATPQEKCGEYQQQADENFVMALSSPFLSERFKGLIDWTKFDELKQDLQRTAGNVKVLNEEDSSIMESKYSKLVETPSHANSVIDSCSCVLSRYVRLHEERLQKLTGEKNFPRTCSGEWLQWEMEDGNRTRIWDPGGS